MPAPPVVVYKDAFTSGSSATRVLTQRTVAAGDVVAVVGHTEDFTSFNVASLAQTAGTATIGTITKQQEAGSASHCGNGLFTFTVLTGGTLTLTATFSATPAAANTTFWTFVATGSGGIGATTKTTTSTTTIFGTLTTGPNSAVVAVAADWAATGGATTSLSPSSPTPVVDAHETDGVVDQAGTGTRFSSRGGHWADVGAAGTASYGVSLPTSGAYNLVAVEFLAGGAATDPQWLRTVPPPGRIGPVDPTRWEPWLGTGTTPPSVQVDAAADMVGAGSFGAAAVVQPEASADLVGTGALAAAAVLQPEGTAGLVGAGALAASGTVSTPGQPIWRTGAPSTGVSGTNTSTVTIPAGWSVGDKAFLAISQTGGQAITVTSSNGSAGWATSTALQAWNGTTSRLTIYEWTLTAADLGATVTVTFPINQIHAIGIVALGNSTGRDQVSTAVIQNTASTTATFNGVTPGVDNEAVIYFSGASLATAGTTTPDSSVPTSYTEEIDQSQAGNNNHAALAVGYRILGAGTAGATETPGSITLATAARSETLVISAAPAAGGVSAAADMVGAGSLAAAGVVTQPATAALVGAGALAAAGVVTQPATASLVGAGTLSAAALVTVVEAAALTGAGTLSAAGVVTRPATAALVGAGTLAAAAVVTRTATAALVGAGTLAAAGVVTQPATAALVGTGSLAAAAAVTVVEAATFVGAGTLFASTGLFADLRGTGTLTAAGVVSRVAAAALVGAGTLTAAAVRQPEAAATLLGTGTLAAAAVRSAVALAALVGAGTLTAAPFAVRPAAVSLVGVGVLLATAVAAGAVTNPYGVIDGSAGPLPVVDAAAASSPTVGAGAAILAVVEPTVGLAGGPG